MARGGPAIVRGGIAHEMGHNFGFGHSNLGDLEYLNLYNVMAGGVANMNQLTALSTAYRVGAGIDEPGEIRTVAIADPTQPVTRTETVAPRTSEDGQRALAVTPPDTGETFYVEYRSGQDRDADSPYVHGLSVNGYAFRPGVVVEEVRWGAGHGVSLLTDRDTRFRTATIDGETWTSPSGTVTVSVAATDASGAEVTVAYAPPPAFDGGEVALSGIPMVGSSVAANLTGIAPAPAKVTWQWLRDGSPIPSATASSYVPTAADHGGELSVVATASPPVGCPRRSCLRPGSCSRASGRGRPSRGCRRPPRSWVRAWRWSSTRPGRPRATRSSGTPTATPSVRRPRALPSCPPRPSWAGGSPHA